MPASGPSTRALEAMPSVEALRQRCRALAMLDAVLAPDWESRYYSFDSRWAPGEMMASMRNGSGDEWFILFTGEGAIMKGFDHESIMSPRSSDLYDRLPDQFTSFLGEPAFSLEDATFCIWRRNGDSGWETGVKDFPPGEDPDGSAWMLDILGAGPVRYQQFAREYYEVELPLGAIERVYNLEPITEGLVRSLKGSITITDIESDIVEIGYPRL